MIPQDRDQPGPPGRVTVWGYPWHGLITGGEIHLPNDTTHPHPQPTTGDVHLVRIPDVAPTVRTPAQAAQDTAAGRAWLDYLLMPGQQYIYGQVIGINTWIYAAPDGTRWLISTSEPWTGVDFGAPFTAHLTATRFGELGRPAEAPITLDPVVADMQQTTPTVTLGTQEVRLASVAPDGREAVFVVQTVVSGIRYPLGFLLLELTGVGETMDATLTVLHSRAATLGAISSIDTRATETVQYTPSTPQITTYEPPGPPPFTAFTRTDTIAPAWVPEVGGYITITRRVGTLTHTLSKRVLWVWYDDAGVRSDVTLEGYRQLTMTAPNPSLGAGGSLVIVREFDASGTQISEEVTSDSGHFTFSLTMSEATTLHLVLSGAAGSVELDWVRSTAYTYNWQATRVSGGGGWDYSHTLIRTNGTDYLGEVEEATTVNLSESGNTPDYFTPIVRSHSNTNSAGTDLDVIWRALDELLRSGTVDTERLDGRIDETRFNIHTRSLVGPVTRTDIGGAEMRTTRDMLAPAALDGTITVSDPADPQYHTYHPVTHEIVRDSAVPVCWV